MAISRQLAVLCLCGAVVLSVVRIGATAFNRVHLLLGNPYVSAATSPSAAILLLAASIGLRVENPNGRE